MLGSGWRSGAIGSKRQRLGNRLNMEFARFQEALSARHCANEPASERFERGKFVCTSRVG